MVLVRALMQMRRAGGVANRADHGAASAESATAQTVIAPTGIAYAGGESWSARSRTSEIGAGTPLRVVGVEGLELIVEPASAGERAANGGIATTMEDLVGPDHRSIVGIAIGAVADLQRSSTSCASTSAWWCSSSAGCRARVGPGIVLLIPFVQQAVKVDLRERFLEVPQQTCITKDNAPISIDFLVYSKVFDPQTTVTAVTDFTGA